MSNKTKVEVEVKLLTALAVAKYRPRPWRRVIRDLGARSLFLVVHPSGAMSWQMRFRVAGGRIGKMTLGSVDHSGRELTGSPQVGQPLSLAAARLLAAEQHRLRAMGRDPVADAKTRRERQRSAVVEGEGSTFGVAARDFIERYASKRVRGWREQARLLGLKPLPDGEIVVISGGLAQRWGDRQVAEIDGHDIHGIVAETRERGAPGLERRSEGPTESWARSMLACLSRLFGWLAQHRRVAHNPCIGVHRPDGARARERVLTDSEVAALWRATDARTKNAVGEPFASVLRLLLLTGCRRNEIAGLCWEELSADGGAINLPGSRTKNHRPHVVPLAPLAREIIARVPRIADCRFAFTTNARTPVSGWSKVKRRLDAAMGKGVPPWRIHDLRRTAVTGMAELGVRPDVIELCVNHVSGHRGGIAGVYNRSELLPERAAALSRWARHVEGLVSGSPSNVVALSKKRGKRT